MDWIKKNPAQFGLAVVSVVTLGIAAWTFSNVSSFSGSLTYTAPSPRNDIAKADLSRAEAAFKELENPVIWNRKDDQGSLFVAEKFIIKDGKLIDLKRSKESLHPPVSNDWIAKFAPTLDITSGSLLTEDQDADGFNNLEEWNGADTKSHTDSSGAPVAGAAADSTDPTDPKSHPPYTTKLRLTEIRKIPFRLKFMSHDGDPVKKAEMTFFINTLDLRQPTQTLKLGEPIKGTRYKLLDFKPANKKQADGTEKDVSVLEVQNTEFPGDKPVELIVGEVTDSPESFAVFNYLWAAPGTQPKGQFAVRKNGEFDLPPETDKKYKLIDIKEGQIVIKTPSGEDLTLTISR